MSEYQIAHDGIGYRVYRTERGIDRHYIGPRWETPRAASQYVDALQAAPDVSPSRREPADLAPGEVMELWGK